MRILLALGVSALTGCATQQERALRDAAIVGSEFAGFTDDGAPFAGYAWHERGTDTARFCAIGMGIVCEGPFSTEGGPTLSTAFACPGDITGEAVTQRFWNRRWRAWVPYEITGRLSTGQTFRADFKTPAPLTVADPCDAILDLVADAGANATPLPAERALADEVPAESAPSGGARS